MNVASAMKQKNPSRSQDHVEFIDAIRGLAALSVALLHIREVNWIGMREYWSIHGPEWSFSSLIAYLSLPLVWGSIGVPIFFVISGYVIHRGNCQKLTNGTEVKSFWLRRFIRIYPAFVAAIFLTWVCDSFSEAYGVHDKFGDLSFDNAILNLLAVVGLSGTTYGSNGPLWSLALEIQFYVVYPVALIVWRCVGANWMLFLTLAISFASYAICDELGVQFFATYYFSWWLGAYVADRQGQATATARCLLGGVFLLGLGCTVFFLNNGVLTHMVWSVAFALVLHYLLNRSHTAKTPQQGPTSYIRKTLAKCGDFSYSLYAIHLPIAFAFNMFFFGGAKQENIGYVIPCLALTLIGAYLVYLAVELPSIKALQRLSGRARR
jgi:peptidoglycan/LPS O-acetylase OafA/YrhL